MRWIGRLWTALLLAAPLRMWAMILAGPPMLGMAAWLVTIITDAGWPIELRDRQLDFIGWALLCFIGINAVIIVTLAAARVRATGPAGVVVEINSDNQEGTGE